MSALLTRRADAPTVRVIEYARRGLIPFVCSEEIVAETREVLLRPRLQARHGLEAWRIEFMLARLRRRAEMVNPPEGPIEGPDPNDAHLWHVLRTREGAILITGDLALRNRAPEWAHVMTPREWLDKNERFLPTLDG